MFEHAAWCLKGGSSALQGRRMPARPACRARHVGGHVQRRLECTWSGADKRLLHARAGADCAQSEAESSVGGRHGPQDPSGHVHLCAPLKAVAVSTSCAEARRLSADACRACCSSIGTVPSCSTATWCGNIAAVSMSSRRLGSTTVELEAGWICCFLHHAAAEEQPRSLHSMCLPVRAQSPWPG